MRRTILKVVAFVVLTGGLTIWLAASIVGFEVGGSRYTLKATFDDVAGLRSRDEVKLAGVAVGKVSGIDVERGKAIVSFSVDESVVLPTDSTVRVRWRNLIGQRYLALEPGSDDERLDDGDTVERAVNVVDLGELVNQLAPLARTIAPDDLNRILTAVVTAFEGNEANYDRLLADLQEVMGTLAERDATLGQMVTDYEAVAGALADRDQQIQAMVTNLVAISETFASNDALLDEALVQLAGFAEGLDGFLSKSAADFGSVLESLSVLTGTASDGIAELEAGLQNLPGLFRLLLPAINRGEWVRVSVLCLTVSPGPCPYPVNLGYVGDGE